MKRVKLYILEEIDQTPTLEDIQECVRIADGDDCIVKLLWTVRYSGKFERLIYPGTDPEDFFKNVIPHNY